MAVDPDDVKRVLSDTELSNTDLNALIDAAGRLYDPLISGGNVPSDTRDDVVTRLAAHLVATGPERQISSAGEGGGNVSFEGETGEGLSASTHGQIALMLDPTGSLGSTAKPAADLTVPDVKSRD
jgi:hypothetical protein